MRRMSTVVWMLIAFGSQAVAAPGAGSADPVFRIEPNRPVAELKEEALAAEPPREEGDFRDADLVELTALDPGIKLDIRYATTNNFLSTRLYDEPRAFLQRPAAEALVRAHRAATEKGYGLLIHDASRPWWVTRVFWDATPENLKHFVAETEWWHFDYKDWSRYPILNLTFEELDARR